MGTNQYEMWYWRLREHLSGDVSEKTNLFVESKRIDVFYDFDTAVHMEVNGAAGAPLSYFALVKNCCDIRKCCKVEMSSKRYKNHIVGNVPLLHIHSKSGNGRCRMQILREP